MSKSEFEEKTVHRENDEESGWGEPPSHPVENYWPNSEETPEDENANYANDNWDATSPNDDSENNKWERPPPSNKKSSHSKKYNAKDNFVPPKNKQGDDNCGPPTLVLPKNKQGDDNCGPPTIMDNEKDGWDAKKAEKGRDRTTEKDRVEEKPSQAEGRNGESSRKSSQKGGFKENYGKHPPKRDWSEDFTPQSFPESKGWGPRGRGRGGAPRNERDNSRRDSRDHRGHHQRPSLSRTDGNRYSDYRDKTSDNSTDEPAVGRAGGLNDSIHAPKSEPPYVNKERVLSGGNARQRMREEELDKRMEQIRIQNEKIIEKHKMAEEDKKAFLKEEEEIRRKELEDRETQRKIEEEKEEERKRREHQQKQLQEQLDNEREENAKLKTQNRGARDWDKEKDENNWNSRQNQRNNSEYRNYNYGNSQKNDYENESDRRNPRNEDNNYDRGNPRQESNEYGDYGRRTSRGSNDYGRRNSRGGYNESGFGSPRGGGGDYGGGYGSRNNRGDNEGGYGSRNYHGDRENDYGSHNSRSYRPARGRGGRGRGGDGRRGGFGGNPRGTGRRYSDDKPANDDYGQREREETPRKDSWDTTEENWTENKNQTKSDDQNDNEGWGNSEVEGGWGVSEAAEKLKSSSQNANGSGWD